MKKIILFGFMLVSSFGYSQELKKIEKNTDYEDGEIVIDISHSEKPKEDKNASNYIHTSVEKMPEYQDGGLDGFRKFIAQNYRAPKITGDLKGNIIVQFVVETDGSLTDIKVIRDLGYGTGAEAIRVLKKSKKWIPGIQKERPVRVSYTLPISINIQGSPAVIKSE